MKVRDRGIKVSIAGAILWGFERDKTMNPIPVQLVSIAGAILWGFERSAATPVLPLPMVSIAGAILWGFEPRLEGVAVGTAGFNRRRDSLGL